MKSTSYASLIAVVLGMAEAAIRVAEDVVGERYLAALFETLDLPDHAPLYGHGLQRAERPVEANFRPGRQIDNPQMFRESPIRQAFAETAPIQSSINKCISFNQISVMTA